MLRSLFFALLALVYGQACAGGYLDLSRDDNDGGRDVTTLVAGGELKGVQLFGVYASTGYGEVLLGHTLTLGKYVTVTPYVGAEWLPGLRPKLRGMLVTSAAVGDFSALSVIEFAGHTNNFNLQQVGYTWQELTFSYVWHSVAGDGPRLDWKALPAFGLYVRHLDRRTSVGLSYSFSF